MTFSSKSEKSLLIVLPSSFSKYALKDLIPEISSLPSILTVNVSPALTSVALREILLSVGAVTSAIYGSTSV